ncbi:MAG: hypothetical protein H7Z37_02945 [Pyrinomonadaceae bacterium]|nr:hypothetical protein [Pyrinomonadaceae bacterium]
METKVFTTEIERVESEKIDFEIAEPRQFPLSKPRTIRKPQTVFVALIILTVFITGTFYISLRPNKLRGKAMESKPSEAEELLVKAFAIDKTSADAYAVRGFVEIFVKHVFASGGEFFGKCAFD